MRRRSTIELMVIAFTAVVCFTLVMTGIIVAIVEIRDPETDTDTIVQSLISLISGILGALLGLIAGRSSATAQLHQRPDGGIDDLGPPP